MRLQIVGLALALGLLAGGQPLAAQDFPSRPLRFLQGFAPGGNADVIARVLGDEMSKSLGQPVVAEARPGAGGNFASEQTARATPDGYTIVLLTTAHVVSPALNKALNFDPVKDFEFVSTVTDFPFFVVVHADSPYKTVQDLVAAARAKPGTLTVGTAGVGTGQHMCAELFASSSGSKFVHVPFRGDAAAVTALLGSSVDAIVAPVTAILGNIEGGKFRALAVSGAERWGQLSHVPTVAETVSPDFEMMAWIGVATGKGVPPAVVARLNKAVREAVALPSVGKRLRDLGGVPKASTPQVMTEKVAFQVGRWKDVAQKAGIEPQ